MKLVKLIFLYMASSQILCYGFVVNKSNVFCVAVIRVLAVVEENDLHLLITLNSKSTDHHHQVTKMQDSCLLEHCKSGSFCASPFTSVVFVKNNRLCCKLIFCLTVYANLEG